MVTFVRVLLSPQANDTNQESMVVDGLSQVNQSGVCYWASVLVVDWP